MTGTTFAEAVELYMADGKSQSSSTAGHLRFWCSRFGEKDLTEITADEVDAGLAALRKRGKLQGKRGERGACEKTGEKLSGATVNRYLNTLGSIFRLAKDNNLVRRGFTSPTLGAARATEVEDSNRFFSLAEYQKLLKVARLIDKRWRRMPLLIVLGYESGQRVGNLLALRWSAIDLTPGREKLAIGETKNGDPMHMPLSDAAIEELKKLPRPKKGESNALLFPSPRAYLDTPYTIKKLWQKITKAAGMEGRGFHQLRHGCGTRLAEANVNQAGIMAILGHRDLKSSQRYIHSTLDHKRGIVAAVFGKKVAA